MLLALCNRNGHFRENLLWNYFILNHFILNHFILNHFILNHFIWNIFQFIFQVLAKVTQWWVLRTTKGSSHVSQTFYLNWSQKKLVRHGTLLRNFSFFWQFHLSEILIYIRYQIKLADHSLGKFIVIIFNELYCYKLPFTPKWSICVKKVPLESFNIKSKPCKAFSDAEFELLNLWYLFFITKIVLWHE